MNIFETVKATISVRQAAEYYGLKLSRNQMVNCPFHADTGNRGQGTVTDS